MSILQSKPIDLSLRFPTTSRHLHVKLTLQLGRYRKGLRGWVSARGRMMLEAVHLLTAKCSPPTARARVSW